MKLVNDPRIEKFALILVDHSIQPKPGDRVLVESTTLAEPLVRALFTLLLERGAHPHLQLALPDQEKLFFSHAQDIHLDFPPTFQKLAYDTFEARIRIASAADPQSLREMDPECLARYQRTTAPILRAQMSRGASGEFHWVSTLFPTPGYALEAGMDLSEYADFVFHAMHADDPAPIAYWQSVGRSQEKMIQRFAGHDQVHLRGPHVDLQLSIRGRTFMNSFGHHNMPDGEIYTGPVENSANGWVQYTYPAVYQGKVVEGVRLEFQGGRVVQASAESNQDLLLRMLDMDPGARYLGEFAIGTNFEINRATHNILFDEKIGGSFHTALGAGYPETGSQNKSQIHWDMICDLQTDSEILLDGELIYRDGQFV